MNRNGWIASVLFSVLCSACILTLFSQTDPVAAIEGRAQPTLHLDPEASSASTVGDLVPATLRRSAVLQLGDHGEGEAETSAETRATLRLK